MSNVTAAMVKDLRERTGAGMMECKKALVEVNGDIEEAITVLRKRGIAKAAKRAGKTAAEGVIVTAISDDKLSAYIVEVNCETDFVALDESFNEFAKMVAQEGLTAQTEDFSKLKNIEEARQQLAHKLGENIQLRRSKCISVERGAVYAYNHGSRIGVLVALDQANDEIGKDVSMHIAAVNPQAINESNVDPALLEKEREIVSEQAKSSGKPENIIEKMVEGRIAKFLKEICLVDQPFVRDGEKTVGQILTDKGITVTEFVRFEAGEGIEKEVVDFAEEVRAQVEGE
jgi:elongation factor Ts